MPPHKAAKTSDPPLLITQKPSNASAKPLHDRHGAGAAPNATIGKSIQAFGNPARFLASDIAFLTRYGFSYRTLASVMAYARRNGVEAHEEMIANDLIDPERYYRCLADYLGLDYLEETKFGKIELQQHKGLIHSLRESRQVLCRNLSGDLVHVVAPNRAEIERLRYRLSQASGSTLSQRIAVSAPSNIRAACLAALSAPLSRHACCGLRRHMSVFSAFKVAAPGMAAAAVLGVFLTLLLSLLPGRAFSLAASGIVAALFFLAVAIRLAAALALPHNKRRLPPTPDIEAVDLPVYSILVAVYDEAAVIPGLIETLSAMDWPAAKLDIKIVLEADDKDTIAAVNAAVAGRARFDIVLVPQGEPRTKPRALNYALTLARGDFVVIYDAEDRPHPYQLKAAYHRFLTLGGDIACIQAPLLVDNARHTWLSAMFALEYAGLFDGLLPALARWRLPVLLGGTSNHFRAHALRAVGAWDPYNVTEDADLGIRLKRLGYRVETIDLPTYEEAPVRYRVWLKQRTRWFKGWMQTSLVHMRRPARTFSELGAKGFFSLHLIATSLLASALGYPFFLGLALYHMSRTFLLGGMPDPAFLMTFNLAFGFAAYGFLSYKALSYRKNGALAWYGLTLPFYWILLSVAAWRALGQLIAAPHVWEKTPHGEVRRTGPPWLAEMAADGPLIPSRRQSPL